MDLTDKLSHLDSFPAKSSPAPADAELKEIEGVEGDVTGAGTME